MEIMGKEFYFIYGPIFTLIVAPIIVMLVNRVVRKMDQAAEERHNHLVTAIEDSKKTFMAKLDAHCAIQEKLHKQIDERFWKHQHTVNDEGKVTEDIVIKGGM